MSEPYLHLSAAAAGDAVSSRGRSFLSRSRVPRQSRRPVVRILWARLPQLLRPLEQKKTIAGVDGRASPIREEKKIMIEIEL